MPLQFECLHPGGMDDNSPAFQRWDRRRTGLSSERTVDPCSFRLPLRDRCPGLPWRIRTARDQRSGSTPTAGRTKNDARRSLAVSGFFLLAAVALAGCQSTSFTSYLTPRVTGRVVAADTRQPIADVKVKRVNPAANQDYDDPAKGGQKMESAGGVRTDPQGRFVLDAERDLTLLHQQVWVSVTIAFQREGYLTLRTNFTYANVTTNAPDGAPVVNAGDILLRPASP
jgi:hypothetical protein